MRVSQVLASGEEKVGTLRSLSAAVSSKHRPFPPLSDDAFTFVEEERDAWRVSADPPSGFAVETRVAMDGSWVEVLRVSYSPE